AGARAHQAVSLDADVDDAGALAEEAAQRGQDERGRLAERRVEDGRRLGVGVEVEEAVGGDDDGDDRHGAGDDLAGAWRHHEPQPLVSWMLPRPSSSSRLRSRKIQRTTIGAHTSSRISARITSISSGATLA